MTCADPIHVRPMAADDIEAVAEIRVRTWQNAYAGIVPQRFLDQMSVDFDRRRRRTALEDPHDPTRILVAEVAEIGRKVVGFAVTGPSRDADGAGAGELQALYVHPDAQRRGAGRALLDRATDGLRAQGHTRATVWVLEANIAGRAFYERAGWRHDGARHLYVKTGADLPELRYARSLR